MNTFNINIDKFITYYKISTYSTFMGSIITAFLIIQSFKFGLIFFLFLTAQLFFVQKYCEKNILELIESKLKMMNLEIRTSKFYFASVWNFYFISLTESQEIFLFYFTCKCGEKYYGIPSCWRCACILFIQQCSINKNAFSILVGLNRFPTISDSIF